MTQVNGAGCYDADFTPFGAERTYTNTCAQAYKFEGKERDSETQNDDFGARYYSYRFGRWLSSDWSAVPVAVPYANLTNPQTLNLYAMVADDPESFADLDGHVNYVLMQLEGEVSSTACAQGVEAACDSGAQQQQANASQGTTVTAPTTAPPVTPPQGEIDAAVERILSYGVSAGVTTLDVLGGAAVTALYLISPQGGDHRERDQELAQEKRWKEKKQKDAEAVAAAGGSGKGLPPGANKLRGNQGYRDKDGNTWKKDQLHKDHWDVTDRKGNKIKEVTFDGRQIWPDGTKNKNK